MTDVHYENWEVVIGLEIHVQLSTKSKMFGTEPYHFGSEPNMDIGVVCTGQPGALPVVNKEAVHKAVQFGCAVKANVALVSRFDRKSYFYPDNPKNFQITQFDHPIVQGGMIVTEVSGETKHFKINRAHLEEDSGMLKHFTTFSGVDFNRAGVPLLEIVSEPCIHSPKEAAAYAMAIKAIMEYIEASDCNMDEGSLRMDANISVRPKGEQKLRTKVEIKNMNSFSHMEEALESEIRRQIQFYTVHPHEKIEQGTYRFDPETGKVILMRLKEQAEDYRYFPRARSSAHRTDTRLH
jgi:aspartyl-tRNA(Asn)/glutamyl-tRNA(Gln) amidotransferase subunit B